MPMSEQRLPFEKMANMLKTEYVPFFLLGAVEKNTDKCKYRGSVAEASQMPWFLAREAPRTLVFTVHFCSESLK